MSTTPKGYNCETCDIWHEFPMYVYAHMRVVLKHKCDNCGAVHSIVMGTAKQSKKGRKPRESSISPRSRNDG